MIFLIIRIFPFLIPAVYGLALKSVFVLNGRFLWPLVVILAVNFLYFLLLYIRKRKSDVFVFLFHSSAFISIGFSYILILSHSLFINLFLISWSLLYFLYLESIFHHFYETKKVLLLDLKNIIAYVNLIAFFLLSTFLINIRIFISFSIWWVYFLIGVVSFLMILSRLRVNNISWRQSFIYSLISSMLMVEVLIAVLFLSVSFYVSAIILTILYYLLSSLLVLSANHSLTKNIVLQYLALTLVASLIIATTAQWL